MPKSHPKRPTVPSTALLGGGGFTETDGRNLAVQLLHELSLQSVAERCFIAADMRPAGTAQLSPVLPYIEALIERRDPNLTRGFASVLSDYLAASCSGIGTPALFIYEEITDADLGPGAARDEA